MCLRSEARISLVRVIVCRMQQLECMCLRSEARIWRAYVLISRVHCAVWLVAVRIDEQCLICLVISRY
jgi:hypothetical protein